MSTMQQFYHNVAAVTPAEANAEYFSALNRLTQLSVAETEVLNLDWSWWE